MKVFAASVALGTFGDPDQRHVADAEVRQHFAGDAELAASAIDQDEIGPARKFLGCGIGIIFFIAGGSV
jgi:hypothetical protein